NEIARLANLDVILGKRFAETVNTLLKNQSLYSHQIKAIGSHGQTIRHYPDRQFTLQIGDPNIIAAETGITTISDLRRGDMAYGGQGAPLVPAFHQYVLSDHAKDRVIVNIGGIANITLLPAKNNNVIAFDTGPGNTLLDAWTEKHLQKPYDANGDWASQGKINQSLLEKLLSDEYFNLTGPKSTGREYFNLTWLSEYLPKDLIPVDVQATLTALTAHSIIRSINQYLPNSEILICGGGVHNNFLMRLLTCLKQPLCSTQNYGINPDLMEAMAFAWLAKQTIDRKPGNIPSVTGAKCPAILGGIYHASPIHI
ncbi:MAG: anhydro-N-acetylmuramic acid kinase, partial [Gammaproteobacteria bacterium]|nr:anhydro-N-acetylmuramic acid kinase [Gammaproteobacteria bacterium]